jgi:hypothetical protein
MLRVYDFVNLDGAKYQGFTLQQAAGNGWLDAKRIQMIKI